jgi:heptosyltransferase-1
VGRYLVSRLSALGDVVCTLPVASALKKIDPDAHIVWVIDPRFEAVLNCAPLVDDRIVVKPGFSPKKWPKIEGEFDAAFDMQGLLKSAVVLRNLKCPKFGFHWQREGAGFFSRKVLPDPTSFHVVDQYVDVVRAFGGPDLHEAEFALKAPDSAKESIREKLLNLGVSGKYAVLNPGAGWATKRWPVQYFAEVAKWLGAKGFSSVLIGGRKEAEQEPAREVIALAGESAVSLAGQTSIEELIALVEGAAVHIGGDTGSTHIASAVKTPLVGLYSITRPDRSGPYGCISDCCYNPEGLSKIHPEQVLEVLERKI